jgi:antitoxin VapB
MVEKKKKSRKYKPASVEPDARRVRERTPGAGAPSSNIGIKRASLFMNGRSQAVRLPKEFRFEGTHVYASRDGDRVILTPINSRWDWLDAVYGSIPDFPDRDQGELKVRPEIEALFDESD